MISKLATSSRLLRFSILCSRRWSRPIQIQDVGCPPLCSKSIPGRVHSLWHHCILSRCPRVCRPRMFLLSLLNLLSTDSRLHHRMFLPAYVDFVHGMTPVIRYDVAFITPQYPVVYSFSLLETNSSAMLLAPLLDFNRIQSSYHISIGHDPFIPTHLVTSVVRGSNEQGLYVGGFK